MKCIAYYTHEVSSISQTVKPFEENIEIRIFI